MVNQEEILLSAARAVLMGDIDSYSVIVENLQTGLICLALGYFHNHEDALEMTQEFFLHLYERLKKFSGKASFKTWCYTVARNFFLKKAKQKKIATTSLPDEAVLQEPKNRDSHTLVSEEETRQEIEEALNTIPEKYSLPLRLFYFEEFSYTEMAGITGLPVGTIRTHLFQGKKRLKTKLSHLNLKWSDEHGR